MSTVQYFEEVLDLSDFSERTDTTLSEEEYRTVEELDVEDGESILLGQGQAANQTDAVGRLFFDPRNSTPADIGGKVRFVVLNTQNNVVQIIAQYQISAVRSGENSRGDRRPFPLKNVEVAEPYKVGIQVKPVSADSGESYSSSDSTLEADAVRGEAIN